MVSTGDPADYRARMGTAEPAGTGGTSYRGGVSCSMCGSTVAEPPLTWMSETDARRGTFWVCDGCARENLRAIEAKLDQQWW